MMSKLFILTGLKHSGKTTIGTLLAKTMGIPFFDSDDLTLPFLSPYDSIRSFYQEKGQDLFMEYELQAASKFLASRVPNDKKYDAVLATGGGACDNTELMKMLKESGIICYIKLDASLLFHRIIKGGIPPFLDKDNPFDSFKMLYERRDRCYGTFADFVVELSDYHYPRKAVSLIQKQEQALFG